MFSSNSVKSFQILSQIPLQIFPIVTEIDVLIPGLSFSTFIPALSQDTTGPVHMFQFCSPVHLVSLQFFNLNRRCGEESFFSLSLSALPILFQESLKISKLMSFAIQ